MIRLTDSLKDYYHYNYPDDKAYESIPFMATFGTFLEYLVKGHDIYQLCGHDSVIRERLFKAMNEYTEKYLNINVYELYN